ncbi:hypothetical protein GO988_05625 [Hymenobacter sp. HMF4947]|uniref:Uncharacterized protein n=1 Tax=Hymenobacter ginkgonis TaxID=2682976 RepID=A0A7K1TCA8_9BACT|nr:hypothetical protein [Hymenobacter ginkgonis]MVN75801.1 hypothetical protein [Hymenobacter ginkgonis]
MADDQAAKLAFLQNFYTNVTLYMPLGAPEQPTEAVAAATPTPAPTPLAAALPIAAAAPLAPTLAAPVSAPGKLPSLAGLSTPAAAPAPVVSAPVTPPVAASVPVAAAPIASPPEPPVVRPTPPPAPAVAPPPVAPPTAPAPVAPYLLTTFTTLGSNAQGVVVLVRLPPEQFIKLTRNVFLNKLLQAINLVMADVVLVNVDGPYPVALQNLRKEIAATHILAFGKNLLDVAVRTTQIYEPVQFPTVNLAYLAGAEVELIEYDVSLKKRLWGGLQRMFLHA